MVRPQRPGLSVGPLVISRMTALPALLHLRRDKTQRPLESPSWVGRDGLPQEGGAHSRECMVCVKRSGVWVGLAGWEPAPDNHTDDVAGGGGGQGSP